LAGEEGGYRHLKSAPPRRQGAISDWGSCGFDYIATAQGSIFERYGLAAAYHPGLGKLPSR